MCGQHVLGCSLPGSSHEGHGRRFSVVVGEVQWFLASPDAGRTSEDSAWHARTDSGNDVFPTLFDLWFLFCVIPLFLMLQFTFVLLKFC